jgi:hypothetical protein
MKWTRPDSDLIENCVRRNAETRDHLSWGDGTQPFPTRSPRQLTILCSSPCSSNSMHPASLASSIRRSTA